MTTTTTLTSKGQVTVPRAIRERMALKPGDKIQFSLLSDGTLIIRPKTRRLSELAGILHKPEQQSIPIEQMQVDLSAEPDEE